LGKKCFVSFWFPPDLIDGQLSSAVQEGRVCGSHDDVHGGGPLQQQTGDDQKQLL